MKKATLFLFFAIFMVSCKSNIDLESSVSNEVPQNNNGRKARVIPVGDPNLNPNFDWTTSQWLVYYTSQVTGQVSNAISTLNPFINPGQQIFGNSNPSLADMYQNQGWMLVSRDFGTPTAANTYPFIVLYNKHRGILRICILRTVDLGSSYQRITLSYANGIYPNLFKFASNPPDLSTGNANNQFTQSALTTSGVNEWMIAEFNLLGFSPTINNFAALNFNLTEVNSSNITLSGNISLSGTAEPQVSEPAIWNGLKPLTTLITKTPSEVEKFIKKPGSLNGVGSALSVVGAIKDFVSSFSSGSSPIYNIKLDGKTSQTGTITATIPRQTISILLKPTVTGAYRALQNIPWGVFNVNQLSLTGSGRGSSRTWRIPANFIGSQLTINPVISSNITQINAKFMGLAFNGANLIPFSTFNSQSYNNTTLPGIPNGVGLQLIFNDGSIVYQVLPFEIIFP